MIIKGKKVLVTGGAGCVGSVLVPQLLLGGCKVRVIDNLTFGGNSLLMNFTNPNFELLVADIRNKHAIKKALSGVDTIVHLAALVGFPACKRDPSGAREINYLATRQLNKLRDPDQLLIFASTSSNYGFVSSGYCNEQTPLKPLSIYGETKTQAEKHIYNSKNFVIYRFATAFGLSPRLRLDLLINDFTYQALKNKYLKVYEKDFMRTFINTRDMARAIIFALENSTGMANQAYNVGNEQLNMSKKDVVNLIKKKLKFKVEYSSFGKDEDQRNYIVDYSKIRKLGLKTTVSVDDGIDELIKAFSLLNVKNPYSNL